MADLTCRKQSAGQKAGPKLAAGATPVGADAEMVRLHNAPTQQRKEIERLGFGATKQVLVAGSGNAGGHVHQLPAIRRHGFELAVD